MYCGMPKGTCQTKLTSNSEKIKPVALAVIELCLTEGISQSVSRKNSTEKKSWQPIGTITEGTFGLGYT